MVLNDEMNHLSGPIDFWSTDLFQNNKSADSVPGNECPCCGSIKIYALGDGRKKCGICGKKFSQTARKRRISKVLLRQVVEQFVAMVPAKQAAGVVGVNHKTALRVYRDIRRALVRKNQQLALRYMEECQSTTDIFTCSPGEETLPLFAVAIQNQKIVLLPARYKGSWIKVHFPASVIYADRMTAMTLDFENFDQKTLGSHAASWPVKPWFFWPYAKEQFKIYHGGMKVNFWLFLHEMVFRFNFSLSGDQEEGIVDDLVACL